jgi:hypothetical protein
MRVKKITASIEFDEDSLPENQEEAVQCLLESLADDLADVEIEEATP